jgi:serine/threonine-protein kinase
MPRAPEVTGSVLDGRYELHAILGEGAFGRVYRGRDRRLDRIVAVKVIKPWWADDPAWAETFEREARLLARVSDPGIVQIFDVGQAREGLYYVAEFVDGESVADRLERGRLSAAEACDIAEQLCRALARAHAQRIVHRDVKPANVLISRAGQVKLGDFGVARLAEGSTGGTAGGVVGTPRYMAPEQARGLKTTPATDVYSAGVVLYEMLAGAPPFSGSSAIEVALSHLHDAPAPLPASTPSALAGVVERALAKDQRERYRDGAAMATALAESRLPERARPPERAGSAQRAPAAPSPSNGHSHSLGAAAPPEPTRVAPRMTPRRNLNPSARRRSIALLGLVCLLVVAMILAAVLLSPPSRVRVPKLAGLSRTAVVQRMHRLHLRSAFTSRFDQAIPGTAIGQAPSPGTRVTEGRSVRVVLSAGPPPVEVPRLAGQSAASARSVLASLGLQVRVASVPAPGTQPGIVTGQSPVPGRYVRPHATVSLTAAETPQWRALTSFGGSGGGSSVPFRIRGTQWRVVYGMSFVGTCTLVFFCDGPSARIVREPDGAAVKELGMTDGGDQTEVVRSGPGLYQVRIAPGSDTTRWSLRVEDYY